MKLKFEEALSEIEAIISHMEDGALSLDETVASYEKGMKFIEFCNKKIYEAEKSLKVIEKKLNSGLKEVDFEEHLKEDGGETVSDFKEKSSSKKKQKKDDSEDEDHEDESLSLNLF